MLPLGWGMHSACPSLFAIVQDTSIYTSHQIIAPSIVLFFFFFPPIMHCVMPGTYWRHTGGVKYGVISYSHWSEKFCCVEQHTPSCARSCICSSELRPLTFISNLLLFCVGWRLIKKWQAAAHWAWDKVKRSDTYTTCRFFIARTYQCGQCSDSLMHDGIVVGNTVRKLWWQRKTNSWHGTSERSAS